MTTQFSFPIQANAWFQEPPAPMWALLEVHVTQQRSIFVASVPSGHLVCKHWTSVSHQSGSDSMVLNSGNDVGDELCCI